MNYVCQTIHFNPLPKMETVNGIWELLFRSLAKRLVVPIEKLGLVL